MALGGTLQGMQTWEMETLLPIPPSRGFHHIFVSRPH